MHENTLTNIPLTILKTNHNLSVRTYNICFENQILDLEAIINYFIQNRNFFKLEGCGPRSNLELTKMCNFYFDNFALSASYIELPRTFTTSTSFVKVPEKTLANKSTLPNITLQYLQIKHNISVRTYNLCLKYNLSNLEEIITYAAKHRDFFSLKGFGRKSNLELLKIRDFYLENPTFSLSKEESFSLPKEESYTDIFQALSATKISFLEKYYSNSAKKFSRRTQNVIDLVSTPCENDFRKIYFFLDNINFQYNRLPNVGKKSVEELKKFYTSFFELTKLIADEKKFDLAHFELFLVTVENSISKKNTDFKDWLIFQKTAYINNNFPIFTFLDFIITDKSFISQRKSYILKHHQDYFESSVKINLKDLSARFDISRERVRQIALPKNLAIPFWKNINDLMDKTLIKKRINLSKYEIDTSADIVLATVHKINEEDNTSFSQRFILKLLSLLLDDFTLINEVRKGKNSIKSQYLIKKEIFELIDLNAALKEIENLLQKKIEVSFNLNLKGFLMPYLTQDDNWKEIDRIIVVFEKIIFEEYDILTDFEGNITIEKNTKKAIYEYLIEILKAQETPMHIDEVFEKINYVKPGLVKSSQTIRSHFLNHSHLFINTDKSTYGLKVWEEQGIYISGSIRDVVEKYLIQFDEPKHIHSISKFVTKHRDTTSHNIYSNIQIDPHNRFTIFGCGFVGLGKIEYPIEKTTFRGIHPHAFRTFEKDYFRGKKSSLPLDYLIKVFAIKHGVQEIQIKHSITQKIENGRFYLKDNFLMLP